MFALHLLPFRFLGARPQPSPRDRSDATAEGRSPSAAAATVDPSRAATVDPSRAATVDPSRDPGAAANPTDVAPSPAPARVDPPGLRVVPLRPDGGWPLRRAADRVPSPFRAFPLRSLHLTRMMSPIDPRD